jgi:hypothetical protein
VLARGDAGLRGERERCRERDTESRTSEVRRNLFVPRRALIASMLSSDPEKSWFRIAKASWISSTRPWLASALAPFAMIRRFPLLARRSFAAIDRTMGSRSRSLCTLACSVAAIFARFKRTSIRSAPMITCSTMSRTRLFSSRGGALIQRSEGRLHCARPHRVNGHQDREVREHQRHLSSTKKMISAGRARALRCRPPECADL